MARTSLSGFPEWLPEGRIVEMHVLDELRRVFELHGFAGIETRAVETLAQLEAKGETSKEIYVLDRLQALKAAASGARAPKDKGMGLHFDLTVPFARYVVENANELDFPFKRYQIQKVWRGERPQEGRFREFTQADIDVVGNGELPFELGELVGEYLKNRCIAGQMPHLRWAYQICAHGLRELDKNDLLRRTYRHERCDACTVELYFCMLLDALDWGGAPLSGGLPDRARTLRAADPRSKRKTRDKHATKFGI